MSLTIASLSLSLSLTVGVLDERHSSQRSLCCQLNSSTIGTSVSDALLRPSPNQSQVQCANKAKDQTHDLYSIKKSDAFGSAFYLHFDTICTDIPSAASSPLPNDRMLPQFDCDSKSTICSNIDHILNHLHYHHQHNHGSGRFPYECD
jgi:hypothetical protein